MDRFWLLTWTTYGTRLPGSSRGFVSNVAGPDGRGVRFNDVGTDCVGNIPPLERYMMEGLACPPIFLTPDHANLLVCQFQETASYRGWIILAVAIMANHIHLLVGVAGDPNPSDILGDFKSYGSRPLNKRWGKPASGTWWTEGGSKRKKGDDAALLQAIRYVRDQENALVVQLNAPAIISRLGHHGELLLGERGT